MQSFTAVREDATVGDLHDGVRQKFTAACLCFEEDAECPCLHFQFAYIGKLADWPSRKPFHCSLLSS